MFKTLFLLIIVLSACASTYSYEELMQNPKKLKAAIKYCQNNQTDQCQAVVKATNDMTALITEYENDPLEFGLKIMMLEQNYVQAKNAFDDLKKKIAQKQMSKDDPQLKAAHDNYQHNLYQMNVLLSAIGMNRPD